MSGRVTSPTDRGGKGIACQMSHAEQGILRLLSGVLLALGEKRVFGVIRVIEDHQAPSAV
jgi:hypothetical protein